MKDLGELAASTPRGGGRVRVEGGGGVCEVVLDHPERRNALTPHMMVDLADVDLDGVRCVLIRGEAGTFCSGGDLGAVRDSMARPGLGRVLGEFMTRAVDRLATLPMVGVLEGHALGGGAELLAACDYVVAARGAEIGFVQAALGVSPGFGGGGHLVRRVGPGRALALLMAAERMPSVRALELGLVDEIHDDPLPRARALAQRIAALPPAAVAGAREVVRAWTTGNGRATELDVFDRLWGGADHRTALSRR